MSIIKKKGSIVPRYLMRAVEKKSQHQVKFGCDVEIVGNTIYMLSDGCCIIIPSRKYCNLKKNKGNNKRRVKGFLSGKNISINGSKNKKLNTAISIEAQVSSAYTINYPLF